MVDLSTRTIQRLFEEKIWGLTFRTIPPGTPQEEAFEAQWTGRWLR